MRHFRFGPARGTRSAGVMAPPGGSQQPPPPLLCSRANVTQPRDTGTEGTNVTPNCPPVIESRDPSMEVLGIPLPASGLGGPPRTTEHRFVGRVPVGPRRGGKGTRGSRPEPEVQGTARRGPEASLGAVAVTAGPGAVMEPAATLTDMYDQALLGILQHVGNVEEFLRVLFGFLYRKTDFYRLLLRPGDRLGFPPGAAQAMTLQAFKAFEHMARQDDERRRQELEAKMKKKEEEEEAAADAERVKLSPAAQEIEVETTEEHSSALDAGGAGDAPELAMGPVLAEPPGAAALPQPQPPELPT
ncbi:nudC domain-containing protein 3 [Indicator indicator]|uniref:nudC domain-containing protein 3 n=1 Tax=Indicator indicator TaxID=1002788 RepID=UPI0023DFBDD8|nr:nudC domain-containing protein 3 [Indicator indicator]